MFTPIPKKKRGSLVRSHGEFFYVYKVGPTSMYIRKADPFVSYKPILVSKDNYEAMPQSSCLLTKNLKAQLKAKSRVLKFSRCIRTKDLFEGKYEIVRLHDITRTKSIYIQVREWKETEDGYSAVLVKILHRELAT